MDDWRNDLSFSDRLNAVSRMHVGEFCNYFPEKLVLTVVKTEGWLIRTPMRLLVRQKPYYKLEKWKLILFATRPPLYVLPERLELCSQFPLTSRKCSYTENCDTYSRKIFNETDNAELLKQILQRGGKTVGRYEHAVHHRDGLFSTIYKAHAASKNSEQVSLVALKAINTFETSPPHDYKREAYLLRKAVFPNVIKLLEIDQERGGLVIFVFPFMPYDFENLCQSRSLSLNQVRNAMRDLFQALAHIHSLGIIHRDVKPSNLLMQSVSGPAYLADFGIAWSDDYNSMETADHKITDVGTNNYRPPELLFGCKNYNCSLDIWAAGCMLAEAANGSETALFDSGSMGSELALIQSIFEKLGTPDLNTWPEAASFPDWGKMDFHAFKPKLWSDLLPKASDPARSLIGHIIRYESGQRLSAVDVLHHPYFRKLT